MRRPFVPASALAALALAGGLASSAVHAHHGWTWAESDPMTLTGVVERVSMAPPHPILHVRGEGGVWQVDLGNPNQTARSGFTAETAPAGMPVTIMGHRSRDRAARHMKAVRVTVGGRHYDIYPERIRTP